ncbi:FUSC family protein [Rhodococcus sp. IEGM 1330]|uniref:FUSC family protein n=1 Tax=Rhodococcus sp. IEGM 1330 TaxID=3082225 RepID=UPI0029552992|nr:FUSC family protein [Rhodococcus sp. IEGM 1330]MDV8022450.1 FUSC family protein [Rhodococcus sp. IEGM 1330]
MRWTRQSVSRDRTIESLVVSAKMAGAAAAAWILATELLSMTQPFLAPYAAVFLIGVTISRSLRSAAEQIATVTAGVLVAALVVLVVGEPSVALAVSVFIGALVGRWSKFGTSGIWIPVTALLVVTYGSASDPVALLDRIIELAVGAAVGVAVNALAAPPLYWRESQHAVESVSSAAGSLLRDVARGLDLEPDRSTVDDRPSQWRARSDAVRAEVRRAQAALMWTEESARGNLRRSAVPTRVSHRWWKATVGAIDASWTECAELIDAAAVGLDPVPPFDALEDDVRVVGAGFVRALADVVECRCDARRTQADVVDRVAAAEEALATLVHTVVASEQESTGATMSAGRLVGPATASLRALT